MIYSNVETKIVDKESGDVYIGEGFESDESMENWSFRKLKGKMRMVLEEKPKSSGEQQTNPTTQSIDE